MNEVNNNKCLLIIFLFISANITVTAQHSNGVRTYLPADLKISLQKSSSDLYGISDADINNSAIPAASSSVSYDPDIKIYSGWGENIVNSFKGRNVYLHLAGAASTVLLISTGVDYHVHKYFNENEQYGNAARPVIRMGNYFPFVIGGSLYAYGKLNDDNEAVGASFAVLQSTLLAFTYNSLLKALTGRPHPNWREENNLEELSKTFRFGFLRGGIFWGWPSGHTSSTFAVISALTNFYPEKTWLKIAGYSYAAYMIFAVSSLNRGGMHWFSDAIAAAFTAYAIGSTVGRFYRSKFSNGEIKNVEPDVPGENIPVFNFSIRF